VLCEDTTKGGLLRIYVRDRLSAGVSGIKVTVSWPGGEDSFFTGLKPEIDPGYADFQMGPGRSYQITLTGIETVGTLSEINIDNDSLCPNLPDHILPSWQIVWQQGAGG
jgi:hypothetical protein